MCRLCLCQSDDENSVEIFLTNDISLTVRIMACAVLEVTQQDQLPKRICLECRLILEKSFLFRNKCKNSDSKLRRHIRLINAGKVSHVFDDSEDEFEDDYSESLKVINELESKINQKQKINEIEVQQENEQKHQLTQNDVKPMIDTQLPITYKAKGRSAVLEQSSSNSPVRTRSSNRLKMNIAESKTTEANIAFDSNGTIEVLMEDIGDDQTFEYIVPESVEQAFDDDSQSVESNDELNPLMVDDNEFNSEPFILAPGTKSDELYSSEESVDEKQTEDEDAENEENDYYTSLLESILPKIKQSITAKSGTVLDDKRQYEIIRSNGNEIKVQCISSDGKEFEIEMVEQPNPGYERDESGDLKIFACSKCPKTFSRRGKLINHERDHKAKTNGQECPYCQKWFPSNSTLTRHIRVHTGEKPFKCNICSRSFIQKEILKRHLMTHSGERPFKCSHCPKSFILEKALSQHINRNHTENPTPEMHNCEFCPKSFCHSSGLSRHLLIHAGRTFACEYCHKKFNDKSALKRHTVSIHNAAPKKEKSIIIGSNFAMISNYNISFYFSHLFYLSLGLYCLAS